MTFFPLFSVICKSSIQDVDFTFMSGMRIPTTGIITLAKN